MPLSLVWIEALHLFSLSITKVDAATAVTAHGTSGKTPSLADEIRSIRSSSSQVYQYIKFRQGPPRTYVHSRHLEAHRDRDSSRLCHVDEVEDTLVRVGLQTPYHFRVFLLTLVLRATCYEREETFK